MEYWSRLFNVGSIRGPQGAYSECSSQKTVVDLDTIPNAIPAVTMTSFRIDLNPDFKLFRILTLVVRMSKKFSGFKRQVRLLEHRSRIPHRSLAKELCPTKRSDRFTLTVTLAVIAKGDRRLVRFHQDALSQRDKSPAKIGLKGI